MGTTSGLISGIYAGGANNSELIAVAVDQDGRLLVSGIAGGPGGTGDATAANQTAGNNILSSLNTKTPSLGGANIANSIPVNIASDQIINVRDKSSSVPTAQSTVVLANSGDTGQFIIPSTARTVTICITSGSLVHYTEDGAMPTTNSCWFGGNTKEIWDYAVPAGATLKFLAVSPAVLSIQVRI